MTDMIAFRCLVRRNSINVLLVALMSVQSCHEDEPSADIKLRSDYCTRNQLDCSTYYPLEVGNYVVWSDGLKNEITGTKMINGKDYFQVSLFEAADLDGKYGEPIDTWYERFEENKLYLKFDFLPEEILWFDLSAETGAEWVVDFPFPGGSGNLKINSKLEMVAISGIEFPDAYVIEWRFSDDVDMFTYEVLLPGIGIAAHDEFGNNGFIAWSMREIQIGGKRYKVQP